MEEKEKLKELKAKNKKIAGIVKFIISSLFVIGVAFTAIENAVTNRAHVPFHFPISCGIGLVIIVTTLTICSYTLEMKNLIKAIFLQDKIFGKISEAQKEQTSKLLADWKENYTSAIIFFRDINILRSFAIILLSRQISKLLNALGKGFRLDATEYQEFYQASQKKLTFILKSKKDNKVLQELHQTSCTLLKETSFSLE